MVLISNWFIFPGVLWINKYPNLLEILDLIDIIILELKGACKDMIQNYRIAGFDHSFQVNDSSILAC